MTADPFAILRDLADHAAALLPSAAPGASAAARRRCAADVGIPLAAWDSVVDGDHAPRLNAPPASPEEAAARYRRRMFERSAGMLDAGCLLAAGPMGAPRMLAALPRELRADMRDALADVERAARIERESRFHRAAPGSPLIPLNRGPFTCGRGKVKAIHEALRAALALLPAAGKPRGRPRKDPGPALRWIAERGWVEITGKDRPDLRAVAKAAHVALGAARPAGVTVLPWSSLETALRAAKAELRPVPDGVRWQVRVRIPGFPGK
jgi:hypothetical protein